MNTRIEVSQLLERVAEALDISPSEYARAKRAYRAVGEWLDGGSYPNCSGEISVYPQGSLRLGTIVKPHPGAKDAGYDVDIVCEIPADVLKKDPEMAEELKQAVGVRLKENTMYAEKLDDEGRRCWTLEYAETNGVGFHLDILPCSPDREKGNEIRLANPRNMATRKEFTDSTVAITNFEKNTEEYSWTSGNPKGYADWFREKNTTFRVFADRQNYLLLERSVVAFTEINEGLEPIPENVEILVRTPLQRAIQIMKRHRDIYFTSRDDSGKLRNSKHKPISMIITTLAARLYSGETDLIDTLQNILSRLASYSQKVGGKYLRAMSESVAQPELIERYPDGKWRIENPVNPDENFADRWHEDDEARANAFFEWVAAVDRDIRQAISSANDGEIKDLLGVRLGQRAVEEAYGMQPEGFMKLSQTPAISTSTLQSRFDVKHREQPQWDIVLGMQVTLSGEIHAGGRWKSFSSDCAPLPKHCKLRFRAETDVAKPFTVHWQVVNTGPEAEAKGVEGLRGQIFRAATAGAGGLNEMWRIREENTLYRGMHWVECFIVKDGVCVARSGEFVVNIE